MGCGRNQIRDHWSRLYSDLEQVGPVMHETGYGNSRPLARHLRAACELAALVGLAAFLAFSFFSGRLRFFVVSSYMWLAPAAAVVILAMAAARLWAHRRAGASCQCACGAVQPGRIPQTACVAAILLGIGFALWVNPQQYSAEGIRKRRASLPARDTELEAAVAWILGKTGSQEASATSHVALPKNPTVVDLFEAAANAPRTTLEGEFVTVVGQCILRDGPTGRRLEIYRLIVTCCVADATAVSVEVARNTAEALEPGGWVSVGGIVKFDSQDDPSLPVIHAATLTKIAEPSAPYL
jgi:uncharacterized repeat protein (TIGR03943 family)